MKPKPTPMAPAALDTRQLDRAAQARERSPGQECDEDQAPDMDAAAARSFRIAADDARPETPARVVEDQPHDDSGHERDWNAQVELCQPVDRQPRTAFELSGLRQVRVVRRIFPWPEHEVPEHERCHEIQQQGRERLVQVEEDPKNGGDAGPEEPAERAEHGEQRQEHRRRQLVVEIKRAGGREHHAAPELALSTDVHETGTGRHRNGKAGEDERGRADERVLERHGEDLGYEDEPADEEERPAADLENL